MLPMIEQPLGSDPPIHKKGAVEEGPQQDNMAEELALVAQLGLKNLRDILSAPAEYDDGPLLRAKNAAAQTALNAQLRADENRLQQSHDNDGLARVLKLIAEEEARMRGTIVDQSPIRRDPSES
jgi:hypothetical protein